MLPPHCELRVVCVLAQHQALDIRNNNHLSDYDELSHNEHTSCAVCRRPEIFEYNNFQQPRQSCSTCCKCNNLHEWDEYKYISLDELARFDQVPFRKSNCRDHHHHLFLHRPILKYNSPNGLNVFEVQLEMSHDNASFFTWNSPQVQIEIRTEFLILKINASGAPHADT